MPLISNTYGKGRVRVMRVNRGSPTQDVRELTVKVMLEGAFEKSYTVPDNSMVIATDSIKNAVYIVAHENVAAETEPFGKAVAKRFLDKYPQIEKATVTALETKWPRLVIGGEPHPHSFVLDSNGQLFAEVTMTRDATTVKSGVRGFSFMKSTESGWVNFVDDDYRTLKDTTDRIAATAMDATWVWSAEPADYPATNAKILDTLLTVFATTYSEGIQDSLYRMGEAALAAVPEISEISMACPNKHYLPMNLTPFGLPNDKQIFVPTDEPHGQIECTVGRG